MFICAGAIESFPFAKSVGIGLVDSAIGLTRLILMENPNMLIFLGSAGSYDLQLPLLSIHESVSATQIELSYINNLSYTPIDNKIVVDNINVSHETSIQTINSSNYITADPESSKQMTRAGILLENMEYYSILSVAKEFRIPTLGIFCVTNYTNHKAHQDFLSHRLEAMKLLESYAKEYYAKYL